MAKALFPILLLFLSLYQLDRSKASSIPSKFDGFAYSGSGSWKDSILIEAFLDPLCPDSRDAWPPLKKVVEQFSSRVSLIVHPFPLPYGSSRGVYGAPFFFVNGFLQPDAGSPLSYSQWINIIEPLLENNAGRNPTLSFYL